MTPIKQKHNSKSLKWKLVSSGELLSVYKQDWQRLTSLQYGKLPIMDFIFVSCALKHFGHKQVRLAVCSFNSETVALFLIQPGKTGVWDIFHPSQAPVGLFTFNPSIDGHALFYSLFHELPTFSWMIGINYQDYKYFRFENDTDLVEQIPHATTISVEATDNFDHYWSTRPKSLRKNVKRYFNRLANDNIKHELKVIHSTTDVAECINNYGTIESGGWKGKQGTAINSNNLQGKFYTEVLSSFANKNATRVYELYFNGQLIASRLTVFADGVLVILKTTYNEEFSKYAPGRVQLYLCLEHIFKEGMIHTVEFYTNASRDQMQWATSKRGIKHYNFYRNRILKFSSGIRKNIKSLLRK